MEERRRENSGFQRLAWFAGLWAAGVATLAVVGYGIRYWLGL